GVDLVDLEQELPLLHLVPFVDGEVGDLAGDGRRDVDLLLRLDLAVGADLRLKMLAPHLGDLQLGRLGSALGVCEAAEHRKQHDGDKNPENLTFHEHRLPKSRARSAGRVPTAAVTGARSLIVRAGVGEVTGGRIIIEPCLDIPGPWPGSSEGLSSRWSS